MSFSDSGHWYDREGNPCHEVPLKTDPTRTKPTTVASARELGLVPSVTTILKAKSDGYRLASWKSDQLLSSAYAHRGSNLPLDQWSGMVKELAFEKVGVAADAGTQYHLVVESIINNEELPDYELDIPSSFFEGFSEWWHGMEVTPVETEVSFAHPLGYGGRMDFVGVDKDDNDVFIDWKTQDTKPGKPAGFYRDSFPIQLMAYAKGYANKMAADMMFVDNPRLISVVISRNEPGRIEYCEWKREEHGLYWDAFCSLLRWWKYVNDYDPAWEV